jgi:AcrR family transcriptional regulator
MKQGSGTQTRARLIEAAMRSIRTEGVTGLTLDGVAKGAGVSKGGLLHHFPSKEALIEAILRGLFADFEAQVRRYYEEEVPAPGRWLRAYVRATFDDEPLPLELITMLSGGIAESEALLALIREDAASWAARLNNDGVSVARATVIRRAADATWIERALDDVPEDPAARRRVLQELLDLTVEDPR